MRAAEFTRPEPRRRFADGYLEFSDHFEQRLRERNIKKEDVLRMLDRLERTRSIDLIKMPFINFLVKSPNLDLAISKQLDNRNRTAYIIATTRDELRGGEDEDVIYLEEDSGQSAAGCILYAEDTGRFGFQQRSDSIDDGGLWAAWGGGREPGETLEQCARRELAEESGYRGPIKLHPLDSNAKYATFIGVVPHEFEPHPDPEWQDFAWVEAGAWPGPMHPGVAAAVKKLSKEQLDELDFMGMSRCTKDCSGHEAGYAWSKARGGAHAASWSPSFNKGAEIAAAGY